jgi:hypothetical protein
MKRSIMLGVLCLCLVGFARAEEHEKGEGACRQDIEKLCAGIQPGEGRIAGCLKSHQADLSEGCKNSIKEHKEKMKAKMEEKKKEWEPCNADLKKFCSDVKQGQGRLVRCLGAHETELTPACQQVYKHEKEEMKEKKEKWQEHHKAMNQGNPPTAAPQGTPDTK